MDNSPAQPYRAGDRASPPTARAPAIALTQEEFECALY